MVIKILITGTIILWTLAFLCLLFSFDDDGLLDIALVLFIVPIVVWMIAAAIGLIRYVWRV